MALMNRPYKVQLHLLSCKKVVIVSQLDVGFDEFLQQKFLGL